ncbi:VanZ family protein [Paraglaciecola aquimarina]|uniref:VanZ family protein n=1 Tax=Paraglaciecola algarum TaxID=3050085 RepID=A0ABS9D7G1_9ALTE|nr:VanZ family protein [Paraglaciecola sp. G1-23]MCF2947754.1 VanZ family protein [Paraglaciecola sp. G1-23]
MRILLVLITLIAYGSLYPFEFISPLDFSERLEKLLNFNLFSSGIMDAIANTLLFIPLGIAASHLYKPHSTKSIIIILLTSAFYAYFIQVLQLWSVSRIPFGGDAVWNLIGTIIGLTFYQKFSRYILIHTNFEKSGALTVLVLLYAISDLQPFIPTIDIGLIKTNVKAVVELSSFNSILVIKNTLFYLVLLHLLKYIVPKTYPSFTYHLLVPLLISMHMFIMDSGIDINVVIGGVCAWLIYNLSKFTLSTEKLANLILLLIVFNALNMMEYRSYVSFNWIPFKPALGNNTLINILAILEKSIFYFLFFYLSLKSTRSNWKSIGKLSVIVFALEILQTNIKGTTPDITENIVLLCIAWLVLKLKVLIKTDPYVSHDRLLSKRIWGLITHQKFRLLFSCWFIAVCSQAAFMSLPQLPYNIAELYNNDGTVFEYSAFFAAALVLTTSITWIADQHRKAEISNFAIPIYSAYASAATFLLLKLAVTNESLSDVIGSSNITYQLTQLRILGDFGYMLVTWIGQEEFQNTARIIEPYIRFTALTGPFIYMLVLLKAHIKIKTNNDDFQPSVLVLVKSFIVILPWFLLCKIISFDFSSTDNLNELIAREGEFGLGGGGYLYALLLLISTVISLKVYAFNKKQRKFYTLTLFVFILSIPVSWIFLNHGLVDSFVKYGNTFSGVDFLIGGSRSNLLSEFNLLIRWSMAYLILTTGLSVLFIIAERLLPESNKSPNIQVHQDINIPPTKQSPTSKTPIPQLKFPIIISLAIGSTLLIGLIYLYYSSVVLDKELDWAENDVNIIFDHHAHTTGSDGKLSVKELVKMAVEHGCDAISITDHTDSKRSLDVKPLDEIKSVRLAYPNTLILSGAELNPPSYSGREHVNVLFTPDNEDKAYIELRKKLSKKRKKLTDEQLFEAISDIRTESKDIVAIYNHPSRKDFNLNENKEDYRKWNSSNLFIGFSGAPGHQNAKNIGSYNNNFKTIDRWDPVVAEIGGTLDQLLEEGENVYGAIASSDFHNEKLDFPPCAFSRIHVSAPDKSYSGLMSALKNGTFWASQGNFLAEFKLIVEVSENNIQLSPGESSAVDKGSIALVSASISKNTDFQHKEVDIELITNCVTGKVQQLKPLKIPAYQNETTALVPIYHSGKDNKSCFLRSRARLISDQSEDRFMAYTNHIRLFPK